VKILVFIKETPDTEAKIIPTQGGQALDEGSKWILNPYDENAVEAALGIKDRPPAWSASQEVEVVVASFGLSSSKERMIKALAMGADRGLLVVREPGMVWDSYVVAKILSKVAESEKPDLIFCGKQGIDDDNMHIPPMIAECLDWPHMNGVTALLWKEDVGRISVERDLDGGARVTYGSKLPILLGIHQAFNSPRYASLPGIMKAKKKPFDEKSPKDFGLSSEDLRPRTRILSYELPKPKPPGKMIQGGSAHELVSLLVASLKDEAKVI
jgi:electron transfer flavoprotein beta subunit